MSLRPEISGFSLSKLRAVLATNDAAIARRATQFVLEQFYRFDTPSNAAPMAAALQEVFSGKLRATPPRVEKPALINAVVALAFFDQDHVGTHSNMWKSSFTDLVPWEKRPPQGVEPAVYERARTLLEFALVQRSLFGAEQESDWTTYGYLTAHEAAELLGLLRENPALCAEAREFGRDFMGYLTKIVGAGRDYFFYCR